MNPAVTPSAVPTASPDGVEVFLRDIEDLHDEDLDLLLADRLAEGAALRAVVAATTLAREVTAPAALSAHALGAAARRLAS